MCVPENPDEALRNSLASSGYPCQDGFILVFMLTLAAGMVVIPAKATLLAAIVFIALINTGNPSKLLWVKKEVLKDPAARAAHYEKHYKDFKGDVRVHLAFAFKSIHRVSLKPTHGLPQSCACNRARLPIHLK